MTRARTVIAEWLRDELCDMQAENVNQLISALESAGFAIVPVEPTERIAEAVLEDGWGADETYYNDFKRWYRAMLSAAKES